MNAPCRIRILMVTATLGYGGAESSFHRLVEFFSEYADVTIALMAQNYGSSDYSTNQSSTVHRVVLLDEAQASGSDFFNKILKWRRMLKRLRALKSEHDVTISFLSGPNLLNAFAGRSERTIVSERGSKLYHTGISTLRKFLWLRILDPMTYRRAAKIVPASIGYAEEIAQIGGFEVKHKIHPIEGGINAEFLLSVAEAAPDSDIARFCQGPTAIYSGRLDRGKGIDLLLPAFAKVRERQSNARLLLIGDGPLRKEIVSICQSLRLPVTADGDLEAAVFLAGYRSDPIRHFRLCQLFLFPSLHEGLGNSLIEGVASGIPVLAADCPWGPRSILSGGELQYDGPEPKLPLSLRHGMLMPLPDTGSAVELWADAIGDALAQPEQPRHSRADRFAAIARYDFARTGSCWLDLVRSMAQKSGQR